MLWLIVTISSQFANAGAMLLDKFLLTKNFPKPAVLTIWTGIWNLLGVVFVFFDFNFFPGWRLWLLAFGSGLVFTLGLQFFYAALKSGEASHMGPIVGGLVAIVSLVLSYFWLSERLLFNQWIAFVLLVMGVFIISFEKSQQHNGWHKGMIWAVLSGILFGLCYFLARVVYLEETFSTGFVWGRLGAFVGVLPFFLFPSVRRAFFVKKKKERQKTRSGLAIFAVNKSLAGVYFLGMNYAVSLASATLVNALAGLQYTILFVLIYIFSKKLPRFFKEKFTRLELFQQSLALLLIMAGLAFMVF